EAHLALGALVLAVAVAIAGGARSAGALAGIRRRIAAQAIVIEAGGGAFTSHACLAAGAGRFTRAAFGIACLTGTARLRHAGVGRRVADLTLARADDGHALSHRRIAGLAGATLRHADVVATHLTTVARALTLAGVGVAYLALTARLRATDTGRR